MNIKIVFLLCCILIACIHINAENDTLPYEVGDTSQQGKIRINGTVLDKERNPLIGVMVLIKGQELNALNATTTDNNGHFYLDVPDKESVLEINYIGFKTQEVIVGSNIHFTIILEEDITNLEEVVVTGYGSQKKMSVIGAIESVSPQDLQVGTTRSISNIWRDK